MTAALYHKSNIFDYILQSFLLLFNDYMIGSDKTELILDLLLSAAVVLVYVFFFNFYMNTSYEFDFSTQLCFPESELFNFIFLVHNSEQCDSMF